MPSSAQTKSAVFNKVRSILLKHAPPMVVAKDKPGAFELIGNKAVPYGSRKTIIPGMYFAAATERKEAVTFHFFPVYFSLSYYRKYAPSLMKLLKGKSCFHFKTEEQVNEKEMSAMLKQGIRAWKHEGYMKGRAV